MLKRSYFLVLVFWPFLLLTYSFCKTSKWNTDSAQDLRCIMGNLCACCIGCVAFVWLCHAEYAMFALCTLPAAESRNRTLFLSFRIYFNRITPNPKINHSSSSMGPKKSALETIIVNRWMIKGLVCGLPVNTSLSSAVRHYYTNFSESRRSSCIPNKTPAGRLRTGTQKRTTVAFVDCRTLQLPVPPSASCQQRRFVSHFQNRLRSATWHTNKDVDVVQIVNSESLIYTVNYFGLWMGHNLSFV